MDVTRIDRQDRTVPASPVTIDFHHLFHVLREKLWLIGICVAVTTLIALVYALRSPKLYVAQCLIQVQESQRRVLNIEEISPDTLEKPETLKTLERNLTSRPVIERVVESEAVNGDAANLGIPPRAEPYSEKELVRALAGKVSVALVRGTRHIAVYAEDKSAETAARLANALVREYKHLLFEQRSGIATEAHEFLKEKADRLKAKLEQSERALQEYKEKSNAVSLEESQNIIVAQLKELNAKETEAKTDRLKLEAAVDQVNRFSKSRPEELLSLAQIANSSEVAGQRAQVGEMEAEIANLSERYGERHPKMIQARSKLTELKAKLRAAIQKASQAIILQYEAAQDTERRYAEALHEQEKKALDLNQMNIRYSVLAREVESDRALFDSVLTRLKETDVSKGIGHEVIQVIEPAVPPDYPVKPRRKLILAGGLAAGMMLGTVLTVLSAAFDNSFRTVDQVESHLGGSVLAAVPKRRKRLKGKAVLVILNEPDSIEAEAFRTLRTALCLPGSSPRSFLFTSSIPGEGKTFCAVNCAASFAQLGSRTLLIDADLRVPSLASLFFDKNEQPGLCDVLNGTSSLDGCVRQTSIENLSVLTAGTRAGRPAEMLTGIGISLLIREALEKYDHVIFDSAPVQSVSDTLLLVKDIESVCLVISAGKTPRKMVKKACERLSNAGARLSGIVFNGVPAKGASYYHYESGKYGEVYGVPGT
jgi:succinoglycan biosynthesis transport protein ExoP